MTINQPISLGRTWKLINFPFATVRTKVTRNSDTDSISITIFLDIDAIIQTKESQTTLTNERPQLSSIGRYFTKERTNAMNHFAQRQYHNSSNLLNQRNKKCSPIESGRQRFFFGHNDDISWCAGCATGIATDSSRLWDSEGGWINQCNHFWWQWLFCALATMPHTSKYKVSQNQRVG